MRSWADVQQLLWTQYQTLIWRPAELLNGAQHMTCPAFVGGSSLQPSLSSTEKWVLHDIALFTGLCASSCHHFVQTPMFTWMYVHDVALLGVCRAHGHGGLQCSDYQ